MVALSCWVREDTKRSYSMVLSGRVREDYCTVILSYWVREYTKIIYSMVVLSCSVREDKNLWDSYPILLSKERHYKALVLSSCLVG